MRFLTLCLVVSTIGCASQAPAQKSRDAASVTADLLAGSQQPGAWKQRATSNCYPACPDGFACNEDTAACEAIPCHRKCREDQFCNTTGAIESCVTRRPAAP